MTRLASAVPPAHRTARSVTPRDAVICGDAVAVLRKLRPGSVHLAVTSPPYNVGIAYRGYSDDRSYVEYRSWLRSVWEHLYPALVPGGRFALNVAPTSIKNFRPIHHDLTRDLTELGYILRTEIIWYKQTMGRRTAWGSWRSPANPHVIPSWEYVLVFSKESWRLDGDASQIDISSQEFQTFSDGFWAIPPERNRRGHPAPFPWELIERLVKFYTYRGNTVLDMFGGTGTVAAVAHANGRHFFSIDASPEYCEDALRRVRAARPEPGRTTFPTPTRVVQAADLPDRGRSRDRPPVVGRTGRARE
jgi:DNA modification methylase